MSMDNVKLIVMQGDKELGAFTLTKQMSTVVLGGRTIVAEIGGFDGLFFTRGRISEKYEG